MDQNGPSFILLSGIAGKILEHLTLVLSLLYHFPQRACAGLGKWEGWGSPNLLSGIVNDFHFPFNATAINSVVVPSCMSCGSRASSNSTAENRPFMSLFCVIQYKTAPLKTIFTHLLNQQSGVIT